MTRQFFKYTMPGETEERTFLLLPRDATHIIDCLGAGLHLHGIFERYTGKVPAKAKLVVEYLEAYQ